MKIILKMISLINQITEPVKIIGKTLYINIWRCPDVRRYLDSLLGLGRSSFTSFDFSNSLLAIGLPQLMQYL